MNQLCRVLLCVGVCAACTGGSTANTAGSADGGALDSTVVLDGEMFDLAGADSGGNVDVPAEDTAPDAPDSCDDGDPCTTDWIDGDICLHKYSTAPCSDGNVCTSGDVCAAGKCAGTDAGVICKDDGDLCTIESCDPKAGCVSAITACDDAASCTTDACVPSVGCQHKDICPQNACSVGTCDVGKHGCVYVPKSDGLACMAGAAKGSCKAGICVKKP